MKLWSWQKENLPSVGRSVRTAFAATEWIVALHRFIEVSVGIVVALLVVAIWARTSSGSSEARR